MAELIYGIFNGDNFQGTMWETKLGKIVTTQGKIDISNELKVVDANTGKTVKDIDLLEVLMEILPQDWSK